MNQLSNVVGAILIIVGVVFLSYTGYTYTTREKVVDMGPIQISADTEKTVPFSPIIGGVCLALGIGLIAFNRMKR